MAIQGPALSEMTNTVLGAKPKPAIHMAVHRQTTINRERDSNITQPVVQQFTQQPESIMLNEGGIVGSIPEGRPNYFHSQIDPLPFMYASNDAATSPTPVITLYDLVAVMDDKIKSKAFYQTFVNLVSVSNIGSTEYRYFMKQHANFIVYYAYTSNGNVFSYDRFRTVLCKINGDIGRYFTASGKYKLDSWMRLYNILLVKLHQ